MKKILVPTDFSPNSKSGVRFAISWTSGQRLELVFIHILNILRPTQWSDAYFEKYAKQEEEVCRTKLEKFIEVIYGNMNVKPGKRSFEIVQGTSADITILDYCRKKKDIDYICISTRGTGKFKKIFGTNTGNLITKSEVPVIAIPKTYKVADIRNIMYAADFRNYSTELKKVIDFAMPLKSSIEVLHFSWPDEIVFDENTIDTAFKKKYKYGLKIFIEKYDATYSLIENLEKQIKRRKPSVVVMFTNQQRTFFQKLFLSSKAEELSFKLSTPLLVFSKN